MIEKMLARRDALKFSALGAAALVLPLERVVRAKTVTQLPKNRIPAPYTQPFAIPPVIDKTGGGEVPIVAQAAKVQILPGVQTTVFGYNGVTPGPTIHARRGVPITVRVENRLPATHPQWGYTPWTSTHLHGSASKPQYDGYASDVTNPAENAYMGLAAQYHLHDDLEDRLPIPKWNLALREKADWFSPTGVVRQFDLPLVLADKMFGADGNLRYDDEGHSGLYGDIILVNGVPWPTMKVYRRKYRFRVLNASISRGYRLQLGDGKVPLTVIGTDGGLMPAPQTTAQLRLGMAERYEVVIDFARFAAGQKVELRNLGVPNSRDFDNTGRIMQFDVSGETGFDATNNEVPAVLNPNQEVMGLTEAMSVGTVRMDVVRQNGMWKIESTDVDGRRLRMTWEEVVRSGYQQVVANPKLGDVQVWEITNKSGGWFHPVHIHLVDFKILSRNGRAPFAYEQGPKDVAYVGENETVRAIMRFGDATDTDCTGRYMIHCHNLPHEDHDMMTQFRVGTDTADNDPMAADRPSKL
jgi:spore coat protein A, manganese oxidase